MVTSPHSLPFGRRASELPSDFEHAAPPSRAAMTGLGLRQRTGRARYAAFAFAAAAIAASILAMTLSKDFAVQLKG